MLRWLWRSRGLLGEAQNGLQRRLWLQMSTWGRMAAIWTAAKRLLLVLGPAQAVSGPVQVQTARSEAMVDIRKLLILRLLDIHLGDGPSDGRETGLCMQRACRAAATAMTSAGCPRPAGRGKGGRGECGLCVK